MKGIHAAAGVVCLVALVAGCRSDRGGTFPVVVETDKGRFPHAKHVTTPCVDCHAMDAVVAGKPARPGANDHAPCDRAQCHREAFLKAPGDLCKMCHATIAVAWRGATTLAPYPPVRGPRALAAEFSHAAHLNYASMEKRVGFHVSCTDCHTVTERGISRPGHTACIRCHAGEAAPEGTPAIKDCGRCHKARRKRPSRLRRLIQGDLRFAHARHRTDRRGKLILCTECHKQTGRVASTNTHRSPATAACVACHDDDTRVPPARRMRVCETCHTTRTRTIGTIAPRSHLPEPDRPEDHTLAFRRDHATDARRNAGRCARCHTFMSGSNRGTCDECHQVMRPQDHVVTWREFEHGPQAAMRADRCTTCHVGEFCSSCHSRPPRSHIPLSTWRSGGHGPLAAFNMRSCITCHTVHRDCTTSGCHRVRVRRR